MKAPKARFRSWLGLLVAATAGSLGAAVRLPAVCCDGAVLQQGMLLPVWGWHRGLTDGDWPGPAATVFATGLKPQFPKHVTIDLGQARTLRAVRLGVPTFGATESVAVAVGEAVDSLSEIGRHDFVPKADQCKMLRFTPRQARHVRVAFLGNHPQQDNFDAGFCFLREAEAFEAIATDR